MKGIFNKTNTPYVIAGSLATLALLTSGVFAAAPYVASLASVAALNFGLPFIMGCAVFSAVVIALSVIAISKNKIFPTKGLQLTEAEILDGGVLSNSFQENAESKQAIKNCNAMGLLASVVPVLAYTLSLFQGAALDAPLINDSNGVNPFNNYVGNKATSNLLPPAYNIADPECIIESGASEYDQVLNNAFMRKSEDFGIPERSRVPYSDRSFNQSSHCPAGIFNKVVGYISYFTPFNNSSSLSHPVTIPNTTSLAVYQPNIFKPPQSNTKVLNDMSFNDISVNNEIYPNSSIHNPSVETTSKVTQLAVYQPNMFKPSQSNTKVLNEMCLNDISVNNERYPNSSFHNPSIETLSKVTSIE